LWAACGFPHHVINTVVDDPQQEVTQRDWILQKGTTSGNINHE